jgi:hypothetical protein
MNGEKRREELLKILQESDEAVSGSRLSELLRVSRQVIVQDIALLRAGDNNIISTNRGYVLLKSNICQRIFKVRHTVEEIEDELNAIVDLGGRVTDVFVYHRIYGVVTAPMHIKTRKDIYEYLQSLKGGISSPLSRITDDYHYHTVTAESEETLDQIQGELEKRGYLAKLLDFEPVDFWEKK